MGHPRPLFVYFRLFQHTLQILQQIYVKKCPSSIRCWDSNRRPLGHDITTRPELPHLLDHLFKPLKWFQNAFSLFPCLYEVCLSECLFSPCLNCIFLTENLTRWGVAIPTLFACVIDNRLVLCLKPGFELTTFDHVWSHHD